ncbi:adipocyte plasma membrane-associated protein-like [Centruroides vittatus]|uniref:adipocyte plasma membrane-associated protein-like n=1 Tax=Centruroides vittatus TaxID=120091 RepID=UPI00350EE187
MSFLFKLFAILGIVFAYFAYSPHLLDFHPKPFTVRQWSELTGPLTVNNRLNEGERLFDGAIDAPESLAVYQGEIYTGTRDGCITKISGKNFNCFVNLNKLCEKQKAIPCSRPLGLRFDAKGTLYVADAQLGLLQVDIKKGTVTTLVSTGEKVEEKEIMIPDDLDMDENGVIYFSDVSTKWKCDTFFYSMLEHENTGRIIQYDPKTKKASILLDGLYYPNGVQFSKKKDSLLIAETVKERVLKYYLKGAKKGQLEVLVEFPGMVDNLRPSKNGYWVAINNFKNSSKPGIIDHLNKYPLVKKAAVRYLHSINKLVNYATDYWPALKTKQLERFLSIESYFDKNHGMIVEFDEDGKIINSLHSPDGKSSLFSEVLEYNGYLYVGSYVNPVIIKVKQT